MDKQSFARRPSAHPVAAATTPRQGERPFWGFQFRISERRLLLMFGDVIAADISVLVGLALWAHQAGRPFTGAFVMPQVYWFLALPLLWLVLANANDYYNLRVSAHLAGSLLRLASVTAQVLLVYLATFFLSPRGSLPRRFIFYYAITALVLTGIWRGCRLFLIGWTGFRRRAVIVGGGRAGEMIWQALKDEAAGDYEVVGTVSSGDDLLPVVDSMNVLGTAAELPDLVRRHGVSELVMAYINEVPADVFQGVMACYEQGTEVVPMPVLYEQVTGRIPIEHVGEHLWSLVLPLQGRSLAFTLYLVVKRVVDLLFALVGLALFTLALPFLACAIKYDSPGPVFYRQRRLGRGGRVFEVVKLRTMVTGAERTTGPRWATARDARITRVGRVLRKTRLDEVPQLINILRGEMTLIGPRPERPEFVQTLAEEITFYRTRLAVTPGLTGWAQVRYRYGNSVEDSLRKLQYDLYYIRHQSLLLDAVIFVKTVGTVLTLQGM